MAPSLKATGPVVIIVPVLNRPESVRPLLDSIEEATPEVHRTLFVASPGDEPELAALRAASADFVTVGGRGTYARKINAGTRLSNEPLLFSAADDLKFHPGWLPAAVSLLSETVQVVGTNDLGNPRTISGEHSTHSLFTRRYIDTVGGVIDAPPGVVLHEGYPHAYVDDEFVGTAKARGVYAHAFDSYVEHLHFLWGKGQRDAVYRKGIAGNMKGRALFESRRHLWELSTGAA